MTSTKRHRRVRWTTRRAPEGWLPVILIGEEPIILAAVATKALAKSAAKRKAEHVRGESYE